MSLIKIVLKKKIKKNLKILNYKRIKKFKTEILKYYKIKIKNL